jgi:hypothetical protein
MTDKLLRSFSDFVLPQHILADHKEIINDETRIIKKYQRVSVLWT